MTKKKTLLEQINEHVSFKKIMIQTYVILLFTAEKSDICMKESSFILFDFVCYVNVSGLQK